jgi:hypothetical protein
MSRIIILLLPKSYGGTYRMQVDSDATVTKGDDQVTICPIASDNPSQSWVRW